MTQMQLLKGGLGFLGSSALFSDFEAKESLLVTHWSDLKVS